MVLSKVKELDRHMRRFFPEMVAKLEEEGKYRAYLDRQAQQWRDVYQQAIEKGLSHIQAAELAHDAAFPSPETSKPKQPSSPPSRLQPLQPESPLKNSEPMVAPR